MDKLMLKNHDVSEHIKEERVRLSCQWNDPEIFDCTNEGAAIVLFYKLVERVQANDNVRFGKTLFYWDREGLPFLHCLVQEDDLIYRKLVILNDGMLHYDGQFFLNPQKFLDWLTDEKHLIFKRSSIIPDSGLDLVLKGKITDGFTFKYPPDYPPLLLELALANKDYETAFQILKNHSIEDSDLLKGKNNQKIHILKCAIDSAMIGSHDVFLSKLLGQYKIIDPSNEIYLAPIKSAVGLGKRRYIAQLLKEYPPEERLKVKSYALEVAVETGSPELMQWLLESLNPDESIEIDKKTSLSFLTLLYRRFDAQPIDKLLKRLQSEIPWMQLIGELIKFPGNPETYLRRFVSEGGNIESLERQVKIQIVRKAIDEKKTVEPVKGFLNEFPAFKDVLDEVLLNSLDSENAINILIELGIKPLEKHFEKLLMVSTHGPERNQRFLILLSGLETIEEAKMNLAIASAFGDQAVKAVMEKFPDLLNDQQFLLSLLKNNWKGAEFAAKQLTSELLTVSTKPTPVRDFSGIEKKNFMEKFSSKTNIGIEVSMEILIDILALEGNVDKIKEFLIEKSQYIYEFWWRLLFAFQIPIKTEKWESLVESTFPLIEEEKRLKLVFSAFRYFNSSLAYLWMKYTPTIKPQEVLECFSLGIPSADPAVVDVLAELGYLNVQGDFKITLLHSAVDDNAWSMISRLLEKGATAEKTNFLVMTPADQALKECHLSAYHMIVGERAIDQIAKKWIDVEPSKFEELLTKAFLNSHSKDILQLFTNMRKLFPLGSKQLEIIDRMEHFVKFPGTLIVRYPRPTEQLEVQKGYGLGQSTYEEVQHSWGNACEKIYQDFYKEYNETRGNFLEVVMKFAKSRAHLPGYEVWRMGYANLSVGLVTHFHWRYFIYWHLAIKVYKKLVANPKAQQGNLELTDIGYQVYFQPQGEKAIPLSKIELKRPFVVKSFFRARIIHTFPDDIKRILPHLSKLFDEIKNYPIRVGSEGIDPELKKMIALFFWLGSQNTITERGNSQYMLMLHRLLYNIHGFQTGPWNPLYIQPDCIALLLPFDEFYEQFYDKLFDYPPFRT